LISSRKGAQLRHQCRGDGRWLEAPAEKQAGGTPMHRRRYIQHHQLPFSNLPTHHLQWQIRQKVRLQQQRAQEQDGADLRARHRWREPGLGKTRIELPAQKV